LVEVQQAFHECPFPSTDNEPFISVVVCSYNGSRTINECLEHLTKLNYSRYEIIVIDDGSTDNTASIATNYTVRLIRTENRGLSAARNTGWEEARGEIVAYTDDDAYPDPDWLRYLARAFQRSSHAMIGGPNLPPVDDPPIAQCVARSPGGPSHVLLTDTLAEHVPGCNMAFLKSQLSAIGGFDPIFRAAGDDVDVCWRIQERGWTVGFAPAAVVWHHRRSSIKAYWKQQRGYGKAEALLQQKWPDRFNISNHLPWAGRIYVAGIGVQSASRSVVYHGVWGAAPFQRLYSHSSTLWENFVETPELYLLTGALMLLSALGLFWHPMLVFVPPLCLTFGYPLLRATYKARDAHFSNLPGGRRQLPLRFLTAFLHVLQPLARLCGRLQHGLTPWKGRGITEPVLPYRRRWAQWTKERVEQNERLQRLEKSMARSGFRVVRGDGYERWDLEVFGGLWASARVLMAVEEYRSGMQYVRFAAWPRYSRLSLFLSLMGIAIAFAAALDEEFGIASMLAAAAGVIFAGAALEAGRSLAAILQAANGVEEYEAKESSPAEVFHSSQVHPSVVPVTQAVQQASAAAGGTGIIPG
jgi:GT2 family glycosyltransferase